MEASCACLNGVTVAISKLFLNFWGYLVINQDKLAGKTPLFEHRAPSLDLMNESQLREILDEILDRLPSDAIADLNLEEELVSQYRKTKGLMDEVLSDMDTPANQKAQVCNAVVSTLGQLVKLQEDLRKEQTLKVMESCLVEAIKTLPEPVKNEFFAEYERMATKAGLM